MEQFSKSTFSGHKGPVLDIKLSGSNVVATSSDDKTIRLWDTRVGTRATQCIMGFGVDPVDNMIFSHSHDMVLYGSTEKAVLLFDLRCEKVINTQYSHTHAAGSDQDICCFDVHPTSGQIAVGCDDGSISILDGPSGNVLKRLSRVHTNVLGAVAFAPRNPSVLISGGFDSVCCAWDTIRGRPVGNVIDFSILDSESTDCAQQISNPPFVHDILPLDDGRTAVCALGDGSVRLLNTCNGPLAPASAKAEAHAGMATAVCAYRSICVPEASGGLAPASGSGGEAVDAFLSCGADRNIIAWNVLMNEKDSDGGERDGGGRRKKGRRKGRRTGQEEHRFRLQQSFAIKHSDKINTITSQSSCGTMSANSYVICVADVTSSWTMYTMPEAPV